MVRCLRANSLYFKNYFKLYRRRNFLSFLMWSGRNMPSLNPISSPASGLNSNSPFNRINFCGVDKIFDEKIMGWMYKVEEDMAKQIYQIDERLQ